MIRKTLPLIVCLFLSSGAYAATTLTDALNSKTNLTESIRILSATSNINATTVATTNLYTVPAGKTAIIVGYVVKSTAATSITNGPTLGIGVASGEDDIFYPTDIKALTDTGKVFSFFPLGMSVPVAAGSVIKAGIDVSAVGTSQTIQIFLLGFLI